MAVNRSNFAALMAPGLRAVFFDRYAEHPKMYEQVFDVQGMDRQFDTSIGVSGFGLVAQKNEGTPIRYDDPIQGYSVTYVPITYALGYRITEEAYEDDQYKTLGPKMSSKLGDAAAYTREIQAAAIFNNGFGDVGPDERRRDVASGTIVPVERLLVGDARAGPDVGARQGQGERDAGLRGKSENGR